MTNFDIHRFGRTFVWNLRMTKKEMLTNAAAMTFAFLVPFIIHVLSSIKAPAAYVNDSLDSATKMNIFIYCIFFVMGGGYIFKNMKTKEQRITFRMLPATDLEKYVVRVLYATVMWWILGLVAFVLADFLQMLVSLLAGIDYVGSASPFFFSMLLGLEDTNITITNSGGDSFYVALVIAVYAWSFWAYSLYILGGALFRRRQLVLTTLAHFIIGMALTPVFISFVDKADGESVRLAATGLAWAAAAVFIIVCLINWWLSYRIFRRMQVINNKWLNL